MNIRDNLDNHKAMTAMAKALDISEDNLEIDEDGGFQIIGKPNKPLQAIARYEDTYAYYIIHKTVRKCSYLCKKLIAIGMNSRDPGMQKNAQAYLFMRRLPEGDEPVMLRRLLGYKPSRKPKSAPTS